MITAEIVLQIHDDGTVTAVMANSEAVQASQAVSTVQQAMPGSQVVDDPWAGIPATSAPPMQAQNTQPQQWQQQPPVQAQQWGPPQPTQAQPAATYPVCAHGQLKPVAGGIAGPNSRNPGKPYGPFWACQAAQGQPKCRLDQKLLPAVGTFLAGSQQPVQPPF